MGACAGEGERGTAVSDRVRGFLDAGGAVAERLGDGYEPRAEQLRMAEAVAGTLAARGTLLVEAGTGVGKSFAYLAPVIERCMAHGERAVISTHTISLQEQLLEKDIPLLHEAVSAAGWEGAFKAVLVKGRGNYLSIRRLKLASARQQKLLGESASLRSLHVIEDWAYHTSDGSLSTLPPIERPGVWDRVQSDSGNCMGRKCPHYRECFYQNARREMEDATLLVCNHALFFSDLALRAQQAGFLPSYQHVVLDEAHMVEEVAGEHFGRSLAEGRVRRLLTTLFHPRTRKGALADLELTTGDAASIDRAIELVLRADEASRRFFESVESVVRDASPGGRWSRGPASTRLRAPRAVENLLTPAMNELALRLKGLKEDASKEADRFELNAYALRAASIADDADALLEQALPGCAYWAEVSTGSAEGGSRVRVSLAGAPVDVAPVLREHLFAGLDDGDDGETTALAPSVVLTSATLATRSASSDEPAERREAAFAHAMARLGCEGAGTLQLGSPFVHAQQVELFVDVSMPSPREAQGERAEGAGGGRGGGFYEDLVARILDHLIATDGGAFVLFTSFAALNACADRLEGPLGALEMPMLAQGRGVPRGELLARFREDERSVLLGAASFWQGVDVRGRGLRNVIITKLPFDPPDRPLTEARLERIRERGGDPFREESLPRAVIRFKQGFGRLIRSSEDHGRVVVLDPRLLTASYGRAFLAALPDGVEPTVLRG